MDSNLYNIASLLNLIRYTGVREGAGVDVDYRTERSPNFSCGGRQLSWPEGNGGYRGKIGVGRKHRPYNPAPANDPSKPTVPYACRFPAERQQLRPTTIAKPNMSANISNRSQS